MGVYWYACRKSHTVQIEVVKGEIVTAHALTYLTKPYYDLGFSKVERRAKKLQDSLIKRTEDYWRNEAGELTFPEYVYVSGRDGKPCEGQDVMQWHPTCGIITPDEPMFPGLQLGHLTQSGDGWKLTKYREDTQQAWSKAFVRCFRNQAQLWNVQSAA